ncbi:hypothetical protein Scep_019369 [Stephania cephalantha]|uniref:Uncharacterized protein n=1 Tax=Stephania cephalantha TaxID=152367 RepID=A0AAP0NN85_9MAGN
MSRERKSSHVQLEIDNRFDEHDVQTAKIIRYLEDYADRQARLRTHKVSGIDATTHEARASAPAPQPDMVPTLCSTGDEYVKTMQRILKDCRSTFVDSHTDRERDRVPKTLVQYGRNLS